MKYFYISDLILDLYSLDELTPKKRKMVETAFTADNALRMKYEAREKLKQDLYDRYKSRHPDDIIFKDHEENISNYKIITFPKLINPVQLCITAVAVIVITFAFIFTFNYFKGHSIGDTNDLHITQESESIESEKTESSTNQPSLLNNKIEIVTAPVSEYDIPPSSANNDFSGDEVNEDPWMVHNPWHVINNQRYFIIPNGIDYIYDNQFYDNEITNIVFSDTVNQIGESSFANNHLSSIIFPSSIRVIKDKAFEGNPLLCITIGNYVSISLTAIPGDFASVYTRYNKTSGTYIRSNISSNDWIKQ